MSFDEDYFERGIETGKSCYQNYRWIPELTIPLAMTMIDYLGIQREHTVLDFGCAKGYLVKALRLLYRQAWGIDISDYAIANLDPEIRDFCWNIDITRFPSLSPGHTDFCIAKDVFEHIPKEALPNAIKAINADTLFAVIPLGENGSFVAPANDMDETHMSCQPPDWWENIFSENGWIIRESTLRVDGIKDTYYEKYPEAHGFFTLERIQ